MFEAIEDPDSRPSRRAPRRALAIGMLAVGVFVTGRAVGGGRNRARKPGLSMASKAPLIARRQIRTGFTKDAAHAVQSLAAAFEAGQVEPFARLVDVDYEYDYHRLLHDLEAYFHRHDEIRLSMQLDTVEPLPVGFVAEVRWRKTFRVRRTRHRVHEEGAARLVFSGGDLPRLRSVRGEMPF